MAIVDQLDYLWVKFSVLWHMNNHIKVHYMYLKQRKENQIEKQRNRAKKGITKTHTNKTRTGDQVLNFIVLILNSLAASTT